MRFPRSLALVPDADLLFVAGYAEGVVRVHDRKTLNPLMDIPVGTVVRSLHYVPDKNIVTACSSCGLLEIDVSGVAERLNRTLKVNPGHP